LQKDEILKFRRFLTVGCFFLLLSAAAGQTGDQTTYVVKKGDTLWDLAFRFLGDPFQWPGIWHENSYIKDPNLIYPGNSLTISHGQSASRGSSFGSSAGQAASYSSGSSLSSQQEGFGSEIKNDLKNAKEQAGSFFARSGAHDTSSLWASESLFALSIRRKGYFTSEFLAKIGFLWFNKDEKGLIYPGNATIANTAKSGIMYSYKQQTFFQHDELLLEPVGKAAFHAGDTLDIIHSDDFITFGGKTANVVRRTAKACVSSTEGGKVRAVLFKVWDVVKSGDRADTAAHFTDFAIDTIVAPDIAIVAVIAHKIEPTERPFLYHTFIIDKGSKDGVALGDLFAVRPKAPLSQRPSAIACAVHIGDSFSTLVIEKMSDNSIADGDTVSLIRRIKFRQ
jgi:hypothetical protein